MSAKTITKKSKFLRQNLNFLIYHRYRKIIFCFLFNILYVDQFQYKQMAYLNEERNRINSTNSQQTGSQIQQQIPQIEQHRSTQVSIIKKSLTILFVLIMITMIGVYPIYAIVKTNNQINQRQNQISKLKQQIEVKYNQYIQKTKEQDQQINRLNKQNQMSKRKFNQKSQQQQNTIKQLQLDNQIAKKTSQQRQQRQKATIDKLKSQIDQNKRQNQEKSWQVQNVINKLKQQVKTKEKQLKDQNTSKEEAINHLKQYIQTNKKNQDQIINAKDALLKQKSQQNYKNLKQSEKKSNDLQQVITKYKQEIQSNNKTYNNKTFEQENQIKRLKSAAQVSKKSFQQKIAKEEEIIKTLKSENELNKKQAWKKSMQQEGIINKLKSQIQSIQRDKKAHEKYQMILKIIQKYIAPSNAIIINLETNTTAKLPLQFPFVNDKNQTIEQCLYRNQTLRLQRKNFHQNKTKVIEKYKYNLANLHLAKYNMIFDTNEAQKAKKQHQAEWQRLQKKFNLSKLKQQLPMCILTTGRNNNDKFRIQYYLNSIFSQNYTNYKVVLIDDGSTDGSRETYRNYFKFYTIDPKRYTYIQNNQTFYTLQNLYVGSLRWCKPNDIVIHVDGDDELIGRNVFKVFNWAYQTQKAGVVYSNYYRFSLDKGGQVLTGISATYSSEQMKNNTYRNQILNKFSHLRSYRNQLLFEIPIEDLQENGTFHMAAADYSLFYPLLQLSCGRVYHIQNEYHYLYNWNTGLNNEEIRGKIQGRLANKVKNGKKLTCFKDFDDKMKALPNIS